MGQCNSNSRAQGMSTFDVPEAGFSIAVRGVKKMGWKRDMPDFRDRVIAWPNEKRKELASMCDLRPEEHFHIYDQGSLGSCTANAIGAAFHFCQIKEGVHDFTPSRLFIYYNERAMEGWINEDSGAYIRDGIKSVHKLGVCSEADWPYDEAQFTQKPFSDCYKLALDNQAKEYARVRCTLEDLKTCISQGYPFVFGFTVYSSFMTAEVAKTGKMSMPGKYDFVMGGHAVMGIGYNDADKVFVIRNSWGTGWGDEGYFYMPYEFISNPGLCDDFWAVRFVEGGDQLPTIKN